MISVSKIRETYEDRVLIVLLPLIKIKETKVKVI